MEWSFASCVGRKHTIEHAWALVKDGQVLGGYLSINQCCTGLLVFIGANDETRITQVPIVATEATMNPNSEIHFRGQACNGKGVIKLNRNHDEYEWVNKE